jgi:hypothetical protein
VLHQQPELVGHLAPLLAASFRRLVMLPTNPDRIEELIEELGPPLQMLPVLAMVPALPMFLLADLATPVEGPLAAGSTWQGDLVQRPHQFSTTLRLRKRTGNQIAGSLVEDFSSIHGPGQTGTFYLRGVVVGRIHIAFVTYRIARHGIQPGLYELRLSQRGRLSGTWWVPRWRMNGRMWLKQEL